MKRAASWLHRLRPSAAARHHYVPAGADLAALRARIAADGAGSEVQVASDWAAMCLLPWSPLLTSEARWLQYAASRLQQSQGIDPQRWALRLVDERPPRARLALALPSDLLSAVSAAARIRVDFADVLQRLVARDARYCGCVVEAVSHGAVVAVFDRGALVRVRQRRCGPPTSAPWAAQVAATVTSECAGFAAAVAGEVRIAAPEAALAVQCARDLRAHGLQAGALT
jgi:hypothetical protein